MYLDCIIVRSVVVAVTRVHFVFVQRDYCSIACSEALVPPFSDGIVDHSKAQFAHLITSDGTNAIKSRGTFPLSIQSVYRFAQLPLVGGSSSSVMHGSLSKVVSDLSLDSGAHYGSLSNYGTVSRLLRPGD